MHNHPERRHYPPAGVHQQPVHPHPEHTDEPRPSLDKSRLLIGAGVLALLLVALHLTGVIGPGSH